MNTSRKLKFGVLGCSRVAERGVVPAVLKSDFAELGMIAGRSPEEARVFSAQFGCSSYGTHEDVLKSDVDVVYVSLPNALHEEWSVKAANAGKHVYCEKPAGTSFASAKRMVKAAKKNGVQLIEGLMFRYHPQNARVRELIKNGVLGSVLKFDGSFGYAMPERDTSSMKKELQGGSLHACGVYPIAASRMVFEGEPVSVFCTMKIDEESGVDVETHLFLKYPGGKTAFVSSFFGSYYESTYSVLGTKARVRLSRAYAVPRDMEAKLFLDADDKVSETVFPPADHFKLMLDDFCKVILKGKESTKDFEGDLLAQARVIEAARRSADEERIVKLSEI